MCGNYALLSFFIMNSFRFVLQPLTFDIEANASDPMEALEEVLKCNTSEEELLLSFLAREIDDHPKLNRSLTLINADNGSFCYVADTDWAKDHHLRAPVYVPISLRNIF